MEQSRFSVAVMQAHLGQLGGDEEGAAAGQGEAGGQADWGGLPTTPSTEENFKVCVRVRPPLPRELHGYQGYACTTLVDPGGALITLSENLGAVMAGAPLADGMLYATHRFTFDRVYDQDSSQEEVYAQSARALVLSTLAGYNAAIIAYGQTGTGKTYTMEGEPTGPQRGIIPRSVEDIFAQIEDDPDPSSKYLVRTSYLQIYNEAISDLLQPERTNLGVREDRRRGVYVEGLSEWVVRSPGEVYALMARGAEQRATGATKMNAVSSRSHAVCIIIVEKCSGGGGPGGAGGGSHANAIMAGWGKKGAGGLASALASAPQIVKVGKLNLVDLAGSERVHITGATGKRLEESKKINASLSALGNVIAALTDRRDRAHIPYRDSKLTRILEDSLGGNCRTTMMCMIGPAREACAESLSTLKFATRAKHIRNQAVVNEDGDQRTLLRRYEKELRRLRLELHSRNAQLVDKRRLLEVEEAKRRAEADKLAALTALEAASREFLAQKEERRALEAQIAAMQSQLLVGGAKPEDTAAFRTLLAKEHRRIRGEYESRLRELEAERQAAEVDLAQVDRYKGLLLKQRDIMIALTARLNERDEQIMTLQEELEAYDKHQRLLEDALDAKTAELIGLRRAALAAAEGAAGRGGGGGEHGLGAGAPAAPQADDGALAAAHQELRALQLANAEMQQQLQQQARAMMALQRSSSTSGSGLLSALHNPSPAGTLQLAVSDRASSSSAAAAASAQQEASSLRGQVAFANKEKAALRTILEGKVLPLADELLRGLAAVQQQQASSGSGGGGSDAELLGRQAGALHQLLAATVTAMARSNAKAQAAATAGGQQQQQAGGG